MPVMYFLRDSVQEQITLFYANLDEGQHIALASGYSCCLS